MSDQIRDTFQNVSEAIRQLIIRIRNLEAQAHGHYQGGDPIATVRVTTTYTILSTDHTVFGNTDSGTFTVTLPPGVQGITYRIINSGSSGNSLTVAPDGAEDLIGVNSSFSLLDGEVLLVTYDEDDGWY